MKIDWKYTDDLETAKSWLEALPSLIACDFEVAGRYTQADKEKAKEELLGATGWEEKRRLRQIIEANGMSHPSQTVITHFSVAWTIDKGFVIVCPDDIIRKFVCEFLVTTDRKQIWHNISYDARMIYYNTRKIPKNFEDTMQMAKVLTNHVEVYKSAVSLKKLMERYYGKWAVSKDYFTLEEMYNETVIEYACTDACATYYLYKLIMEEVGKE